MSAAIIRRRGQGGRRRELSHRWRSRALVIGAVVLLAVAGTVGAVVVNLATSSDTAWWRLIQAHPLRWVFGSTLAIAVMTLLVWWVQRRHERWQATPIPAEQRLESWVVDRPVEVQEVVNALLGRARR